MFGRSILAITFFCLAMLAPEVMFGANAVCKDLFYHADRTDRISIFLEPELKHVSEKLQKKLVNKISQQIGVGQISESLLLRTVERYYRALDKPLITGFFRNLSFEHSQRTLELRKGFHDRLLELFAAENIPLVQNPFSRLQTWILTHRAIVSISSFFALHATSIGTLYNLTGEISWFPIYLPRLTSMAVGELTPRQVRLRYFERIFSITQKVYYSTIIALGVLNPNYVMDFVNSIVSNPLKEEHLEKIVESLGPEEYLEKTNLLKQELKEILSGP